MITHFLVGHSKMTRGLNNFRVPDRFPLPKPHPAFAGAVSLPNTLWMSSVLPQRAKAKAVQAEACHMGFGNVGFPPNKIKR